MNIIFYLYYMFIGGSYIWNLNILCLKLGFIEVKINIDLMSCL